MERDRRMEYVWSKGVGMEQARRMDYVWSEPGGWSRNGARE